MNKRIAFCLALTALPILAWAQTDLADIPPPTAPFVEFPHPNVSFTITVSAAEVSSAKPPAAASAGGRQITSVDAVQVGALRRDIITLNDGTQMQIWFAGKWGLVQNPRGVISLMDPVMFPIKRAHMLRRDASDYFSWLTDSNYIKATSYGGKICYQFKLAAQPNAETETGDINSILGQDERIAWIDVKTKLPVAIQLQGQLFTYTFRDPPSEPLVPPPAFKSLIDRFQLLGPPGSPAQ